MNLQVGQKLFNVLANGQIIEVRVMQLNDVKEKLEEK